MKGISQVEKKNKRSCQIVWVLLHPLDVIFKIVSDTVTTELQAEMNTVWVLLHPVDVIFKIVSDTVTAELQAEMSTVYRGRQAEIVLCLSCSKRISLGLEKHLLFLQRTNV